MTGLTPVAFRILNSSEFLHVYLSQQADILKLFKKKPKQNNNNKKPIFLFVSFYKCLLGKFSLHSIALSSDLILIITQCFAYFSNNETLGSLSISHTISCLNPTRALWFGPWSSSSGGFKATAKKHSSNLPWLIMGRPNLDPAGLLTHSTEKDCTDMWATVLV